MRSLTPLTASVIYERPANLVKNAPEQSDVFRHDAAFAHHVLFKEKLFVEARDQGVGNINQDQIRSFTRHLGDGLHFPCYDPKLLVGEVIEPDINRLALLDLARPTLTNGHTTNELSGFWDDKKDLLSGGNELLIAPKIIKGDLPVAWRQK